MAGVCCDKRKLTSVHFGVHLWYMNTKFIGVKDFRQNMADYAKKARNKTSRYIIVSRNIPLFELKPFDEDVTLDSFIASVIEGKKDLSEGRVRSQSDILAKFG